MKRMLAMLAALCLMLALPALAEEAVWSYDPYNLYVRLEGTLSGDVVVPGEVDGCEVNAIGSNELQGQHEITSLTLPVSASYFLTICAASSVRSFSENTLMADAALSMFLAELDNPP